MNKEITIDSLLRGQQKLDQMKLEIRQICSILAGAVSEQYTAARGECSTFPVNKHGKWQVNRFANDEVQILFYKIDTRAEVIFRFSKSKFHLPRRRDVPTIHANLSVLLLALRQSWNIDEYLKDYSNAA